MVVIHSLCPCVYVMFCLEHGAKGLFWTAEHHSAAVVANTTRASCCCMYYGTARRELRTTSSYEQLELPAELSKPLTSERRADEA